MSEQSAIKDYQEHLTLRQQLREARAVISMFPRVCAGCKTSVVGTELLIQLDERAFICAECVENCTQIVRDHRAELGDGSSEDNRG